MDGFFDLRADRAHRVEGRGGLLEDEADLPAPQLPPAALVEIAQRPPGVEDPAGDARAFGREAEQSARELRLAAAALSDDSHGLAGKELEAHAVHRGTPPAAGNRQLDAEILDLEQGRGRIRRPEGRPAHEFFRTASRSRTRCRTSR